MRISRYEFVIERNNLNIDGILSDEIVKLKLDDIDPIALAEIIEEFHICDIVLNADDYKQILLGNRYLRRSGMFNVECLKSILNIGRMGSYCNCNIWISNNLATGFVSFSKLYINDTLDSDKDN